MKLYLARHGIALEAHVDSRRPLSRQGEKEIRHLADFLAPNGVLVSHVYHSPLLRAKQTAHLLAATIAPGQDCLVLPGLEPEDSAQAMTEQIQDWVDDTLVVSHLPLVADLFAHLVGMRQAWSIINWQPGTLACLQRTAREKWLLEWLLTPSMFLESRHLQNNIQSV